MRRRLAMGRRRARRLRAGAARAVERPARPAYLASTAYVVLRTPSRDPPDAPGAIAWHARPMNSPEIPEQAPPDDAYPVRFSVDYPDRQLDRLTTAFRIFTVIPIAIAP